MNNPFKKRSNNTLLITVIAVSTLAAGVFTWFYLNCDKAEPEPADHDYLERLKQKRKKKLRTDPHELHHLVPGSHEEPEV